MKIILIIFLVVFIVLKIWDKATKKYHNDCLIRLFIGLPGKGKTTLATKICITEGLRKNRKVYSNFELFGAYKLDMSDFGKYHLDFGSILILDEIGLEFNNREFKKFSKDVLKLFKLHRHYGLDIYCFSQAIDTDVSIVRLVDELYLIEKFARVLSVAKKIDRYLVLHNSKTDDNSGGENFINEDYKYSFPTQWIFTFIPRWVKFFNSFEAPVLQKKHLQKYEFINVPYLFKLTHNNYYIYDVLNDTYQNRKKKYEYEKNSVILNHKMMSYVFESQVNFE